MQLARGSVEKLVSRGNARDNGKKTKKQNIVHECTAVRIDTPPTTWHELHTPVHVYHR